MDISRFGEFAILAQSRTFLDAAELLFMSQSTLSKHIMAMERELGCNLIDRSQRHVTLTAQGEALLPYAQKIATLQHRYLAAIQIAADEPLERITVGSIPIMAPYGITDAVIDFQQANPSYSVELIEGEGSALKQMLLREDIDLAFIRDGGAIEPEFKKIPFTTDRLVAVIPLDHPLAKRNAIEIDDLIDENFLMLPQGSFVSELTLSLCRKAGFSPRVTFTGKRAENIISLVARDAHAQACRITRRRQGGPRAARACNDLRGQALPQTERCVLASRRLVYRLSPLSPASTGRPHDLRSAAVVVIPAHTATFEMPHKPTGNGTKRKRPRTAQLPSEAF